MIYRRLCFVALTCRRPSLLVGRRTRHPAPYASAVSADFSTADGSGTEHDNLKAPETFELGSWTKQLQRAYSLQESDGVIELVLSSSAATRPPSVERVFAHIQEASENKTGVMATMLNAWIASNMLCKDQCENASNALDLLNFWEAQVAQDENVATPDLVTYSVAYAALSTDDRRENDAESILEKALRWSKKLAGSKRRKALAAARRHKPENAKDRVDDIRGMLDDPEFDVLMETDEFLVVNKPAGVACSHRFVTTAGKKRTKGRKSKGGSSSTQQDSDMSLVDALLHCNVQLSTLNPECQGLVHRLDRGTSGCIFLAKTDQIHAHAVAQFFTRQVHKSYITLVSPAPTRTMPESGALDIPVNGRPAWSYYQILKRFGDEMTSDDTATERNSAATIEMRTVTGRKHQVRVHATKGLNAPVLHDPLYGTEVANLPGMHLPQAPSKERFFLHAAKLSMPFLGVSLEAPIPDWWKGYINHFEKLA